MMYTTPFYITDNVGNNAFSYQRRENKRLFVPSMKKISSFDEIEFGDEIAFSDVDFDGKLQEYSGLKNFYELDWNSKPLYLFDNHNHAYFFWHLAKSKGIIQNNTRLYHIDEHADTRDPGVYVPKNELTDLQKIFEYTNFTLNVGNYIIPAQKDGLIKEVVQIRSEHNIQELGNIPKNDSIILNLDLDFFEPALDYIDSQLKKDTILSIAKKSRLITVATSPYFIDQQLALKVFKDIFS